MKIHEFQAKALLRDYGAAVQNGSVAETAAEARGAAERIGKPCAVKAQIHSGGRGKAGGVRIAKTPAEAEAAAAAMLGSRLVTAQTGPEGRLVRRVLVEEAIGIKTEYYFALTVDRASGRPAVIASAAGGVEIEQTAKTAPEKILTLTADPDTGLRDWHFRYLADRLGIADADGFVKTALAAARLFTEKDCSLVEINPLADLLDGGIRCMDAKITFDDSALFRHPDIAALRDPAEEDPREAEARRCGLSYVSLGGSVGCMVNGAGLAMSTMDMIHACGAEPANFLDIGGSADEKRVTDAFRLLLSDGRVKVIFINIFGGIVRCDMIAEGIAKAAKTCRISIPVVVRFDGTNAARGRGILAEAGLGILPAETMRSAAELCAKLAKEGGRA